MPLIYAGGQWRNIPLGDKANVEPRRAPRYVSGEGSIISQAPDLYRPGRNVVVPTPARVVPINPEPPGGGGGNPPPQDETPKNNQVPVESDYDRRIKQERKDLGMNLAAYFKSVGLESLAQWAIQSARDGMTEDWIRLNVRDRPEYKQRFPAMQYYIDNKLGFTEQQYIDYEQTARNLDQRYGLPDNMIYNAVTDLLLNEVDAEELRARAEMAGAAAITAPEDFKQTMRDYYGIDEGGLAAYFLDPDNVQASLERQSAAARTGAIAARQNVPNVARELAEDLYDQGIQDQNVIREGFERVNTYRGLTTGKANTVTREELIRGTFGSAEEREKMRKASDAKLATQRGGGSYATSDRGNAGLR